MAVMLERWNDDKMDALDAKVDVLVIELREQRQETKAELREQRQDTKAAFERMYRLMVVGVIALSAAYLAGFAALVGLVATQL